MLKYAEIIKKENGASGRMFVEKYVKNNYFQIYEDILSYCIINNLTEIPFKEKVYHYNLLDKKIDR